LIIKKQETFLQNNNDSGNKQQRFNIIWQICSCVATGGKKNFAFVDFCHQELRIMMKMKPKNNNMSK
jgi:hypothetical protein